MSRRLRGLFARKYFVLGCVALSLGIVSLLFWHDMYTFFAYTDASQREAVNLAYRISDTVAVPAGEIPGLATVTDVSKLNRGGVLAGAENGDKLLLFYESGRVVVYRPSIHKVISVGPMILDASAAQVKGTRIVVRNGTGKSASVDAAMSLMKERYAEANIADPENAARDDYPSSIAIDLTADGSKTQFVGAISELLGIQKGILPTGESRPDNADILIIIGADFKE